jgi:hypothetical protein
VDWTENDPSELRRREREVQLLAAVELEACRRNVCYWLERYAWTIDEHVRDDPERQLLHGERWIDPETLLPCRELDGGEDDYLLYVASLWWNEDLLAVPKSRQLRLTHLMCNLHGWLAMFFQGQRICFQSKKLEDADENLKRLDKSLAIMRKKNPHIRWPVHVYKHGRILFPNGSLIMAAAQGAAVVRQYTFSAIFCVAPETRVLTEDLRWVSAGDVAVGDGLVGFDEHVVGGPYGRRRWRRADVTSAHTIRRPCYRLVFDDGTEVVCSAEHRWLTGPEQNRKWQTTEELRCTSDPGRNANVVRLVDVWPDDRSWEAGYLAGAFDGEAYLDQGRPTGANGKSFRVGFGQNDNGMMTAVRAALERKGFTVAEGPGTRHNDPGYRNLWIRGRPEILRFLGQIRPHRLLDKFDPELIGAMQPVRGARLVEKEFLGEREVVALSTSTGTFVAEGLASHNSDETAFQPEAEDAYTAAMPTVLGGGKYTAVSSADPGFFEQLVFDKLQEAA